MVMRTIINARTTYSKGVNNMSSSLFVDNKVDLRARLLEIAKNVPEASAVEAEEPLPEAKVPAEGTKGKVLVWPLEVCAQPTELSRTGLFKMLPKGARRLVNDQEIASRSDIKLLFTGEELNVKDETTWMAVLRLCRGKQLGERVYFSIADLLSELKMKDSGGIKGIKESGEKKKDGSRALVLARLDRLSKAHIKIEITRKNCKSLITTGLMKFAFEGETGKMYARLDPDGALLFDNLAYQNWDLRLSLKTDVAVRFLDYVVGHQAGKPHAQRLENLRVWFGYSGRPDKFRKAAMAALLELEGAGVIREAQGGRTTLRWTRI